MKIFLIVLLVVFLLGVIPVPIVLIRKKIKERRRHQVKFNDAYCNWLIQIGAPEDYIKERIKNAKHYTMEELERMCE